MHPPSGPQSLTSNSSSNVSKIDPKDNDDSGSLPQETVLLLQNLKLTPVTAAQIKSWTSRDPMMSKVHDMVLKGWTYTNDPDLLPYQRRRTELSALDGCVLWDNCVIIPLPGKGDGLKGERLW